MGVSGWMFLLVPDYPGCPGQTAVEWLLLLLHVGRAAIDRCLLPAGPQQQTCSSGFAGVDPYRDRRTLYRCTHTLLRGTVACRFYANLCKWRTLQDRGRGNEDGGDGVATRCRRKCHDDDYWNHLDRRRRTYDYHCRCSNNLRPDLQNSLRFIVGLSQVYRYS